MKYLDEYKVGDTANFGSYAVTREEVLEFATRFDPQPFHLDDAAAAAHPLFKKLSASGWHTAASTMRMIADHAREQKTESMGSPGLEEIKWPIPTYPGDTLRVKSEVLGIRQSNSRPEIGFVRTQTTTYNQDDKIVMSFIANIIAPVRPEK